VLAEAFFLRFVLDEANEKLPADHEAVVALAQVASRIKVAHAGPGGRRSTHPRVLVPTWTSGGNNHGYSPHHGGRNARSVPWEIDHREPREHLFDDLRKLGRRCDADQGGNRPAPAQGSLPLDKSSKKSLTSSAFPIDSN
jgi:hypothetical protein